jgi:very-short-patch-repair endonuclease
VKGQTNQRILDPKLQRRLRNAPTDAEHLLWQRLRGRQIEGCKFRRQHPYGDFILDFVCLQRRVIVELDGSQHADAQLRDDARTARIEVAGFEILRFWNNEVLEDTEGVLESIRQCLERRANPSPPNPPLEGEG